MRYLSNLDLNQNELLNARFQNLGAVPSNPKVGQVYTNTSNGRTFIYNGTGWSDATRQVSVVGTAPVAVSVSGDQYTVSVPAATTSVAGLLSAADKTQLTNLSSNLADKAPLASPLFTGLPKIRTNVTLANGSPTTNAFVIESSDQLPLFEVKTNGDTVIAGVLTVNGTGDSTFAGNVNIGGNLNVDGTIEGGATVNLAENLEVVGNLVVRGNTTLGDDAVTDSVMIKGFTKITSKATKAAGSGSASAFTVESSDAQPLFQVMENGDAKIAGVLTVKAVNSEGGAGGETNLEGQTNVQDLTVENNLIVKGDTVLGDNALEDSTTIKGYTTVVSKATKDAGSASVGTFAVKDSTGARLFEVMENGDTIIGGVLKVLGTGESEFAGNVKIGGNLTVMGDATVKGVMSGTDFNIQGNLIVDGNTTLGNNSTQDTTTINGFTKIKTAGLKTDVNAAITSVFKIEDAAGTPNALFDVRQNGDTIIAGSLTVSGDVNGGGTATKDLVVDGNLLVKGNTTLGDASTDTINVVGEMTLGQNLKANNKRITGLAEPIDGGDAATKAYVDATAQGLDAKGSVRAATTANITLSGTQTVDGVALVAGNRILVKNQTTASQNGIYVVGAGSWVRADDANTDAKFTSGMYVFIEEGTVNADTGWVLSTNGPITVGTTSITFTQFSGAGSYTAGNGLTLTGTVFSAVGTSNRITVGAGGIDIASNYVGQSTITTVGTLSSGTWNATTIALNKGGTGSTTAAGARSNLGATGKYAVNIGDGVATQFTINHNLNSVDVIVQIYDNTTKQQVYTDVESTDANNAKVYFASAPGANAYRVVVIG